MKGWGQWFLYSAWLISLIAALISFYFSEILLFEPCRLCWYQRMALFPLALLLGIATYRGDRSFILYGIALAGAGEVISLYHFTKGIFFSLDCGISCSNASLKLFGLFPLPLLSAIGFGMILSFLVIAARTSLRG